MPLAFASLVGTAGCDVYLDAYDVTYRELTLRYAFEGQDCFDADVAFIHVSLLGSWTDEYHEQQIDCRILGGKAYFYDLESTHYEVRIEGWSDEGVLLFAREKAYFSLDGYGSHQHDVDALRVKTDLRIDWLFGNGYSCGRVHTVKLKLEDPQGRPHDTQTIRCSRGPAVYEGLGLGTWTVSLELFDLDGNHLDYSGRTPITLHEGDEHRSVFDFPRYPY